MIARQQRKAAFESEKVEGKERESVAVLTPCRCLRRSPSVPICARYGKEDAPPEVALKAKYCSKRAL